LVQPVNSYRVVWAPGEAGQTPRLAWRTQEGAETVTYDTEPARSGWQRLKLHLLSLLPWESEL
jgi:putative cardiolipin synthase